MKRIITLILGLCICFALMGCGGSSSNGNTVSDNVTISFIPSGRLAQHKIFVKVELDYSYTNESIIDFRIFDLGVTEQNHLYKVKTTVSAEPEPGKKYNDLGVSKTKTITVELSENGSESYYKTLYNLKYYYIKITKQKYDDHTELLQ